MTVGEFNKNIGLEKIQLPDETTIRIIQHRGDEIRVEVNGRYRWFKKRKDVVPKRSREEDRPKYTMDKSDIAVGPSAYLLLQWIRSLETPTFSVNYASRELNMCRHTINKGLQILRDAGKIGAEVLQ